jgi:hypothetical protein
MRRAAWLRFRRTLGSTLRSELECKDQQRSFIQEHEWKAQTNEETHVQLLVQQIVVSLRPILFSCVQDSEPPVFVAIDPLTDQLVDAYQVHLRQFFTQAADRDGTLRKAYGVGSRKRSLDGFKTYFLALTVEELTGAFRHVTKMVTQQVLARDPPPPPPSDLDDEKKNRDEHEDEEEEVDRPRLSLLERARQNKQEAFRLAMASVRARAAPPPRRAAAIQSDARRRAADEEEKKREEEDEEEDKRVGKKKKRRAKNKKKKSEEEKEDDNSRRDFEARDQHYVYLLFDAEGDRPVLNEKQFRESVFYVGQGVGGRCYDHLKIGNPNVFQTANMLKDKDKLKTKIIQRLWAANRGPRIAVVYAGLTQQQADIAEGCLVHTQGLFPRLENIASGRLKAAGLDKDDGIVQRCGLLLGQGAHDFVSHYLAVGGLKEHTNEQGV